MLYGVKMFETLTLSHQKTKLAEEMQRSREGEREREKTKDNGHDRFIGTPRVKKKKRLLYLPDHE